VLPLSRVDKEMADGVGAKMAQRGERRNKVPGHRAGGLCGHRRGL